METPKIKPYLVIIVLLSITCTLLLITKDTSLTPASPIQTTLPDTIGEYTGYNILYCQNIDCIKSYVVLDLSKKEKCKTCSGDLKKWAPGEKTMFTGDTMLLRKKYQHKNGRWILLSILLSGNDRSVIHRPQMCLSGQGQHILTENDIEIAIPERSPLKARFINLQRTEEHRKKAGYSTFVYWFVSNDKETPSHLKRTFYMAYDNIFKGISQRWAYITIMTDHEEGSSDTELIKDFISQMYPLIKAN